MIDALRTRLEKDGWITLQLKVRPGAAASRFRGPLGDDMFKVDIAAAPEDGKANEELVRFLAETFETSKSSIDIFVGQTATRKTIILRKKEP